MPRTWTITGHLEGEPFVAKLQQAQDEGNLDFVTSNLPRLEGLIARLQDRQAELAELQYRARCVREKHEPPAGEATPQSGNR